MPLHARRWANYARRSRQHPLRHRRRQQPERVAGPGAL